MNNCHIQLCCDSRPFEAALASLAKAADLSRETVQRFLGGLDCTAQIGRIDGDGDFALRADECWIVLQPSDLLVEFLAAFRTGERDGL